MRRHHRSICAILTCTVWIICGSLLADGYDPPSGYYATATGTGATLKQQLNDIIDGHTAWSYEAARSILQVTDADPANPGHILLVYNRAPLNVAAINPGGPIPGWNDGISWNREHTWPVSRGLGSTGMPDGSDLFNLRASNPSINSDRGNLNFGGAYGAQPYGQIVDNGATVFYPGDADAGMIARQQFYMAVRYDGTDVGTTNLELAAGAPPDTAAQMGNLNRMIEWHFAAPPDAFERRRNQIIFDSYQHNRNPFSDRPEFVWSVFVDQMNDSQIVIDGAAVNANGESMLNLELGRVYVGGGPPAAQTLALQKLGNDGTYFDVTTTGSATSSITGRFNAFRTGMTDIATIDIGLDASTATAGVKNGTVMIENLDITTGGGTGRGANDANDVIDVSMAVLDHPTASFSFNMERRHEILDFGIVPLGSGLLSDVLTITNLAAEGFPSFAAALDLDAVVGAGDTSTLQLDVAPFVGLAQGDWVSFDAVFETSAMGQFAADYTLQLSDEDLPGEQQQTLTLSLIGEVILSGDYNRDGSVDSADYSVWRDTIGRIGAAYGGADGDGSGVVDEADYQVWKDHFGESAITSGSISGAVVPEASGWALLAMAVISIAGQRRSIGSPR